MKKLFILPLIITVLFLGACSEAPMEPEVPKIPTLEFEFALTVSQDYAPFGAVAIVTFMSGSGNYVYELSQDGVFVSNNPLFPLAFSEVMQYQVSLKVTDLESGEILEKSITATGLQQPAEGLELEAMFFTTKFSGKVPFYVPLVRWERGGTPPYTYETWNGDTLLTDDNDAPVYISETGDNWLTFKVFDANGDVSQKTVQILGLEADPDNPLMRLNFIALPAEITMGNQIGFVTQVFGGYPPYSYQISVEDTLITEPMALYRVRNLGQGMAEVRVTDSRGSTSESVTFFTVKEVYEYEPLKKVEIVAPNEVQQRQDISFQALVFVEYDLVEWYRIGYPDSLGSSDAITTSFDRIGFEYVEARVFNQGVFIAADITRVTVTPADENPSLVNEVTGGPQGQFAPATANLESHPSGGDGNYSYVWYWPTAATIWSTERFPVRSGLGAGAHTFICVVTDGTGATATDDVVITVLNVPGDDVVTWNMDPDLRVGPYDDFATTTTTVEVSGDYDSFVQVEWDAVHTGTQDELLLELIKNVDGVEHLYTWHLIKPASYGHVTIYYEIGNLSLEQGNVTLNMHWLSGDKSSEKCNGWDKWQLISGNATIPADKFSNVIIIRLDDTNRDEYIRRR